MDATVTVPVLMTADETAAYLNVPVATIYRWRATHSPCPPAHRVGRYLRFRADDVLRWVSGQRETR